MLGKKTGGRVRGTKNKATLAREAAAVGEAVPLATKFPAYKLARVDQLAVYERNPRTHSAAQIETLAKLITEYGWTNPVLVDGKRGVIAGHGRLLAAKKLGLDVVPTIELSHLTAAQKRAYVIADNQSALQAGWDDTLLSEELGELSDMGFDLSLTGFSERELSGFMGSTGGNTDPDDVPEVPNDPVSELGNVWIMGEHRLVCGDASLISVTADMVITDPPYSSGGRQDGAKRHSTSIGTRSAETIARDNLTTKGYLALMAMVLGRIDAETAYVFTDWRMWTWTFDALETAGYPMRGMLVWDKETMGMGFPWRSQHELIAYAKRTGATMGDGKTGNVLRCPRTPNDLHPTQKPTELLATIMRNDPGKTVADPFSGSGTTLIAAEMTGRICHAIELEPRYIDVAVRRWQAFTGKQATLEATGATFDAIAAERLPTAA